MTTTASFDTLAVARRRGEELRAEAAAERLLGAPVQRHVLAASLRWAADRLDPAPLAALPASQG